MPSYAPGTIFRIYSADKSKHYTAVLLKNGKVLETKNPDVTHVDKAIAQTQAQAQTQVKKTFDTLDEWLLNHDATEDTVHIDKSKGSGVVIGSDTHGFNYPPENTQSFNWIQWCYSIVLEAAPHLLQSDKFRSEYNGMVDLCYKHQHELRHWGNFNANVQRYNTHILNGFQPR